MKGSLQTITGEVRVPDGWTAIALRRPDIGEHFISLNAPKTVRQQHMNYSGSCIKVIVKRTKKGKRQMKKKDLKTGMIVKTRDGHLYQVILGFCEGLDVTRDIVVGAAGGFNHLKDYTEDLKNKCFKPGYDLMEVYLPASLSRSLELGTSLWKRDDAQEKLKKEIADIEKHLQSMKDQLK